MNDPLSVLNTLGDTALAEIMCNPQTWAETMLIHPQTEKPFQANYAQERIFSSTRKWNTVRCYRRCGKTTSMIVLALYNALTTNGCQVLVVAPHGSHVARIFNELRDFIRSNPWIEQCKIRDTINPQFIKFNNASVIMGFTTGAKSKSDALGVRSQGADIVFIDEAGYLGDGDWQALKPIIIGDEFRRKPPRVFASSTCKVSRGIFYEICKNPRKSKAWNPIHIPITLDPDITPERIQEARDLCTNELEFYLEYMADWPEDSDSIFPRHMLTRAQRDFSYANNYIVAEASVGTKIRPPTRTMGVDWDKFNRDGHGCNIIVLEAFTPTINRVIYREEIPQTEFTLLNAVERIITLNELFQPEWVYIDRGYGDCQEEELRKYGKLHPESGLEKKVVGIAFGQNVEFPLPNGDIVKKKFKPSAVMQIRNLLERSRLEICLSDQELYDQMLAYHVVTETDTNIKFCDENDHLIAALSLAVMAMHQKVRNPYAPKPATQVYQLQTPIAVPKKLLRNQSHESLAEFRTSLESRECGREGFSRTLLGNLPPTSRSNF